MECVYGAPPAESILRSQGRADRKARPSPTATRGRDNAASRRTAIPRNEPARNARDRSRESIAPTGPASPVLATSSESSRYADAEPSEGVSEKAPRSDRARPQHERCRGKRFGARPHPVLFGARIAQHLAPDPHHQIDRAGDQSELHIEDRIRGRLVGISHEQEASGHEIERECRPEDGVETLHRREGYARGHA